MKILFSTETNGEKFNFDGNNRWKTKFRLIQQTAKNVILINKTNDENIISVKNTFRGKQTVKTLFTMKIHG